MRNLERRIDRIARHVHANRPNGVARETLTIFEVFNVPDLTTAIERARSTGARIVTFVPVDGDIQETVIRDAPDEVMLPVFCAFQCAPKSEPYNDKSAATTDQLRRLIDYYEGMGITEDLDQKYNPSGVGDAVAFIHRGCVVSRICVSPEELPQPKAQA